MPNWCTSRLRIDGNAKQQHHLLVAANAGGAFDLAALLDDEPPTDRFCRPWYRFTLGTDERIDTISVNGPGTGHDTTEIVFTSAWTPPAVAIARIAARWPALRFHLAYVEPDMGSVGTCRFERGALTEDRIGELTHVYEPDTADADAADEGGNSRYPEPGDLQLLDLLDDRAQLLPPSPDLELRALLPTVAGQLHADDSIAGALAAPDVPLAAELVRAAGPLDLTQLRLLAIAATRTGHGAVTLDGIATSGVPHGPAVAQLTRLLACTDIDPDHVTATLHTAAAHNVAAEFVETVTGLASNWVDSPHTLLAAAWQLTTPMRRTPRRQ